MVEREFVFKRRKGKARLGEDGGALMMTGDLRSLSVRRCNR